MRGEHQGVIKLETERLLLLPWQRDGWVQLKPIAQDAEVVRYISNGQPWTEERIRRLVDRQVACYTQRGFCLWRLVDKARGEMIGFCGLQPLDDTAEIEIGWWLGRLHWGKGLATEAAREALRDGLGRVGLRRVVAIAQPANQASIHIMQKLGMSFERETTHRGIPVVMYAMIAK